MLSTKKLVLVPNSMGSRSARELAKTLSDKLGYKVFRVSPKDVKGRVAFQLISGTDKLTQLERFKNASVTCPEFTRDSSVAVGWIKSGSVVMCRTLLRASEGDGIVVAETMEQVVSAPLYTKYIKKKQEFRVHVLNGKVIDIQEKRKRNDFDGERDTRIRNLANGYVFCRENITEPQGLRELAIKATNSLGYTLGAVDIIYNSHQKQLVVLEVNANPGLEGTTLERYANAILEGLK